MHKAIERGLNGLALLGVYFPNQTDEMKAAVGQELGKLQSHMAGIEVETLVDLPKLIDPAKITMQKLCLNMIPFVVMSGNVDLCVQSAGNNRSLSHVAGRRKGKGYADSHGQSRANEDMGRQLP